MRRKILQIILHQNIMGNNFRHHTLLSSASGRNIHILFLFALGVTDIHQIIHNTLNRHSTIYIIVLHTILLYVGRMSI